MRSGPQNEAGSEANAPPGAEPKRSSSAALCGFAFVLIAGVTLRLIFPADIEYKGDEAWLFAYSQHPGAASPWVGIYSSVAGILNPGMSAWVFLVFARLFGAHDPVALARAVQLENIGALALLACFAMRFVPARECETWMWAAALAAVNPLAVLFQRKIWPPSTLPLFSMIVLIGWWWRERRAGAFAWGLVGACLGQIQVAGFFFAAGLFGWTVAFARARVRWGAWLAGSVLGAWPLLPWFVYLASALPRAPSTSLRLRNALGPGFWLKWFTEPFGLGLNYSLGRDFADFIRYPLVDGHATYLVLLIHVALIAIAAALLARTTWMLLAARSRWAELAIGRSSPTAFVQNAALWGFGILLTVSCLPIHRSYMIVDFPLEFVWVVRITMSRAGGEIEPRRAARAILAALCALQFALSAAFLDYIHVNGGAPRGDYGVAYSARHRR